MVSRTNHSIGGCLAPEKGRCLAASFPSKIHVALRIESVGHHPAGVLGVDIGLEEDLGRLPPARIHRRLDANSKIECIGGEGMPAD